MDLVVVDDSVQNKPSRKGMGPLVAVGGLHIPSGSIKTLERALGSLCDQTGFPVDEEFKWSPYKRSWMRKHLEGDGRAAFFQEGLRLAGDAGATAFVVIEDSNSQPAESTSGSAEEDVVKLFLERTHKQLVSTHTEALVLADHPSGGRPAEARFLAGCIQTLKEGTEFVLPGRIALVLTGDSMTVRLLQLADIVVGCTLSYVAGETDHAPPLFQEYIKPLLRSERGRIGGVGLKIHPDFRYANLYHWLLGDPHMAKGMSGVGLPLEGRSYAGSPDTP